MSKHMIKIKKGKLGKFSKIKEEYTELLDARKQKDSELEIHELKDLIRAIKSYSVAKYGITLT